MHDNIHALHGKHVRSHHRMPSGWSLGDCIIAELDRLKPEIPCKSGDEQKRALTFVVHFPAAT